MKYSQYALGFYMFALLAFSGSPQLAMFENLMAAGMVFVFLLETMLAKDFKLKWHWSINILCIFAVYGLFFVFLQPEGFRRYITFILVLILFYTVFNILRRDPNIIYMLVGLLAGLLYNLYFNIDQIMALSQGLNVQRFGGTLNPNVFSFLLLIAILLLLRTYFIKASMAGKSYNKIKIIVNLIAIGICAYLILIATGSRKGGILLLFIFLWAYFYLFKNQTILRKMGTTLLGGGLVVFLYLQFVQSSFFARFQNIALFLQGRSVNETSLNLRATLIERGFEMWAQKPFFGWGFEAYRYESGLGYYSHTNYIELLVNHGLIGFMLYYSFVLSVLYVALKTYRSYSVQKGLVNWAILAIGVLLIWDFAAVSYYGKPIWILYGIALATILNVRENK